jgi:predicted nucleotidyltransferase
MEAEFMGQTHELANILIDAASLAEVCRAYGVREFSLFGSATRGEMGPNSDIDMMVEFEPEAGIGMIKFELLAEELTRLAGRRVDLVTKRGLKPWIRCEVLKDLRVIYAA